MTVRKTVNVTEKHSKKEFSGSSDPKGHLSQSGHLLSLEYGSLLALTDLETECAKKPLLAFLPAFVHAAFSQVYVLNLVEARIGDEADILASGESHGSIENLQFLSNILDRHSSHAKDALRALSNLFGNDEQASEVGPTSNFAHVSGTFTVQGLRNDFQDILSRSEKLTVRCTTGIQNMMNRAMVLEAHKAIQQTERLKKLTLLATFFIPLSFVSSLFGMNLRILGTGSLGVWWFFAFSIPITLIAQSYYLWDSYKVNMWVKKMLRKQDNNESD